MTPAGSGSAPATAASPAALTSQDLLSPTVSPLLHALAQVATSPCCWWGIPSPSRLSGCSARSAQDFAKRAGCQGI